MAATFSGNMRIIINSTYAEGTLTDAVSVDEKTTFTGITTAPLAMQLQSLMSSRVVTATTTWTLPLATMTAAQYGTASCTALRVLKINNKNTEADAVLGVAGLTNVWGVATATQPVNPGGMMLITAPRDGFVIAGTDTIRIANTQTMNITADVLVQGLGAIS